jgi:hypothetical protein
MAINNLIGGVIHSVDNANFEEYSYFKVFSDSAAVVTINDGDEFSLDPGLVIDIIISTITTSNDSGVYLIGVKQIYKYTVPFDIKTGLPIND